jgi:hypothetical protein
VGIPVKANTDSGGKPNGIPEETEQQSERSDAGDMIVKEVFGIVNRLLVRAKRRSRVAQGFGVAGERGGSPFIPCIFVAKS